MPAIDDFGGLYSRAWQREIEEDTVASPTLRTFSGELYGGGILLQMQDRGRAYYEYKVEVVPWPEEHSA